MATITKTRSLSTADCWHTNENHRNPDHRCSDDDSGHGEDPRRDVEHECRDRIREILLPLLSKSGPEHSSAVENTDSRTSMTGTRKAVVKASMITERTKSAPQTDLSAMSLQWTAVSLY
jgi:hypothetical protein